MTVEYNGETYYQTKEAIEKIGISRATFFRWIKKGVIEDVEQKDRRGWWLFTKDDINRMRREAQKINTKPRQEELF